MPLSERLILIFKFSIRNPTTKVVHQKMLQYPTCGSIFKKVQKNPTFGVLAKRKKAKYLNKNTTFVIDNIARWKEHFKDKNNGNKL